MKQQRNKMRSVMFPDEGLCLYIYIDIIESVL